MTKNSARAIYLFIVLVVVLLDRWTKHLVAQRIRLYSHIQVIPGFFRLTHTENTGAAFSLFADSTAPWKTGLLIAFSAIALVVVSVLAVEKPPCPHCHRRRLVADYGRSVREIFGIAWPVGA
jgi:lipoprotein signal peptidase